MGIFARLVVLAAIVVAGSLALIGFGTAVVLGGVWFGAASVALLAAILFILWAIFDELRSLHDSFMQDRAGED